MASTPSSSATSTIWSSASRLSCATVVLMLTRSGACLRFAASCSRLKPRAGALERALQPARHVVYLARTVNRDADVLQEPGRREIGQRLGPLVVDDRAVRRQVAAGVALFAEEIEDGHDVLPHEDLAAGEADLEAGVVGERLAQRVERHLLAPFPFDIQQVADVAELAVQVAPHRRFVDGAHRQPIGAPGLLLDEAAGCAARSAGAGIAPRHGAPAEAPAPGWRSTRAASPRTTAAPPVAGCRAGRVCVSGVTAGPSSCQISSGGPGRSSASSIRVSVL